MDTPQSAEEPRVSTPSGRADGAPSDSALRALADAVARLGADPDWFALALTEALQAMKPVAPSELTRQQELFLVESGSFTAESLAEIQMEVKRGSMQLDAAEAWLSHIRATMSLDDVVGFLEWDETAVRTAASEGRLHAVDVSGKLRFPSWQFDIGSPGNLLPGLPTILEAVRPRWSWQSIVSFMSTPQSALVAEGRKTPVAWLRDGGNVDAVRQIVESDDWW